MLATSAIVLALVSSSAYPQQAAAPPAGSHGDGAATVNEIVVTATRQSQSLSKVSASIAAYSQKTMDAEGVRNIVDITRLTPGLALTPLGSGDVSGNNTTISIRGISSAVGSATTGIYVDDTPIQVRSLGNATSNVYPQIFDLDRVEVLRGPQGTLFGAGAEGGAVRFITPQPSLTTFGGYARGEVADTQGGGASYEAGAAVGGPIQKDVLGIRLSAWYRRDGGYIDRANPSTGATTETNSNTEDSYALRGAIKWRPISPFNATFSIMYQDQKYGDSSAFFQEISNPGSDSFEAARAVPDTDRDRFVLPSLNLQYDTDWFSVISTTSYFTRNVNRNEDYSNFIASLLLGGPYGYGPGQVSTAQIDDHQRDVTQEIRIQSAPGARLNWVVGGFYGWNKQTSYQYNLDPDYDARAAQVGGPVFPMLNGNSLFQTNVASVDVQKAVFAQIDYEVLARLKVTAGVRYAAVNLQASRQSQGPVAGGTLSTNATQSEAPVTPKFGVSYQVDPNNLVYVSASKGYRIGGVNGPQNSLCAGALAAIGLTGSPATYKSDSVWSFEGGAKSRLLDGRLQVDASAFDIEWNDIQRGISLSSCGSGFVTNFGTARSTGFDLSGDFQIMPNLTMSGSVGYADAHLTQDVLGAAGASGVKTIYGLNGDEFGGPPWQWTLSGEYDHPLADDRRLYGRVDYQHVGAGPKIDYAVFGQDPLVNPSQSYDQVSLRAGLRVNRVDVSLFVNNALDQSPILSRFRYSTAYDNLFLETTLRPRTFGMTVVDRF